MTPDTVSQQITELLAQPTTTHGLARALRAALKELDVHRTHTAALNVWPEGRIDDTPRKVQIGGGAHRIDGYFNIDVVSPADLLWDVREWIPLHDNSVEDLFSEHFLEHIDYPNSAKHYAREAHRVLAPGGRAVTGVPDAGFVLSRYPSGDADTRTMIKKWYGRRDCLDHINTQLDLINYVFRDQDDDPVYHPHYWAYDHDKLVQLFTEAGFTTVEPWPFDPSIANPKREWASVYVVATK
ncbi:class I SAM-dependent methyltransferase [Streptomyces sp. 4F14]|uniref:class I SAM-dependent methyltransferase n=1 Tax=Streptomyces sp. 4F14 TaxID=3394380 RepID=UPI003A8B9774